MFQSFFGKLGDRRQLGIAYGGPLVLVLTLYIQVQAAVAFAETMNIFGNLVQNAHTITVNHAPITEKYLSVVLDLLGIYLWFFFCETAINYVTRRYQWYWREAITLAYIERWNQRAAAMEGSSQILADAVNNFTQLALTLFTPIVRSALVMFAFLPMLWDVSRQFDIAILGVHIPGILLWVSFLFSGFGTFISWKVGATLPNQEWQVQKYEARFRSEVEAAQFGTRSEEQRDHEMEVSRTLFEGKLNKSYRKLHNYLLSFDLWFNFYKQAWGFLPLTVLGLFVISGATSYGAMMQAMSALNEASGSMSIFSSLMTTYTKYQSYVQRLSDLEYELDHPADPSCTSDDPSRPAPEAQGASP